MPKASLDRRGDIEDLIAKKRDEIVADVREECTGVEKSIIKKADTEFNAFAAQLKEAYSAKVGGQEDLLHVIEKNGFVYRGIYDVDNRFPLGLTNEEIIGLIGNNLQDEKARYNIHKTVQGKQRVTIIIEPVDE